MRTLVEQTRREAERWLTNLKAGGHIDREVEVYTIMGGTLEEGWERFPERPAILVGTQDMLLSRALNRGYAMSRYRWPMHFALLNNDCLWVCDEVQLMGPAFETTLQLDAFRPHRWGAYGPTATWWMSATLDEKGFETVDRAAITHRLPAPLLADSSQLEAAVTEDARLAARLRAAKRVRLVTQQPKPAEVIRQHQAGSLTLVIFNTVKNAAKWHAALLNDRALKKPTPASNPAHVGPGQVLLLHSQFRPPERRAAVERLLKFEEDRRSGTAPGPGLILVTTQVVEAGVDVSARRLWSQVAPWSSVVQRLGRLNRDGRSPDAEGCFWLELNKEGGPKEFLPYEGEDLLTARGRLAALVGYLTIVAPRTAPSARAGRWLVHSEPGRASLAEVQWTAGFADGQWHLWQVDCNHCYAVSGGGRLMREIPGVPVLQRDRRPEVPR
jgi:CRISPR-associated endonuclease/helicase Cas3